MKSSSFPLPSQCFIADVAICVIQLLLKHQSIKKPSKLGGRGHGKESQREDSRNGRDKRRIEKGREKMRESRGGQRAAQKTQYSLSGPNAENLLSDSKCVGFSLPPLSNK